MRGGRLLLVALVAAAAGGLFALVGAKATGWLTEHETQTVLVPEPAAPVGISRSERAVAAAKPLLGNSFHPDRIYAGRSNGVVTIFSRVSSGSGLAESQGSGFVVSRDGYILTNSHVITNAGDASAAGGDVTPASQVFVEFEDGDRAAATIVGWDLFDDVGLLQVDPSAHALAPVPLGDSAAVAVGEPVAVIGSPFGNENSLAVGVVSAVGRSINSLTSGFNLVDAIQIDAPINHGNSGGPLFDARGRVIGITAQINSTTGRAEGVGFAVPINSAKRSMAQLIARGEVAYAYVGIQSQDLTPSLARRFSYPVQRGALIDVVRSGTPAARAGLHGGSQEVEVAGAKLTVGGDVIVAIAGTRVESADDLVRLVAERFRPGQTATFDVYRGGKRLRLPVTFDRRPDHPEAGR